MNQSRHPGRPECANSGHSPDTRRMGNFDPGATFAPDETTARPQLVNGHFAGGRLELGPRHLTKQCRDIPSVYSSEAAFLKRDRGGFPCITTLLSG
jgi:hypothetical protein